MLAIFLVIGIVALAQGKGRGFDFTPLYNADTFSWSLVFGAVSIAVLSFLGFDGISMLAEENKESARAIGRAMVAALLLAGVLFIVQTWVASLLVPDPAALIAKGDPGGTAFYDAAAVAGGAVAVQADRARHRHRLGLRELAGRAGRDLAAAVRDGARPAAAGVPGPDAPDARACRSTPPCWSPSSRWCSGSTCHTRDDGITLLSTLVNFGALTAFLVLHVSVVVHYVVRGGSRDWWRHLVAPVIGFAILAYVVVNAQLQAKWLGLIWFAVGVAALAVLVALGRRPTLALVEDEAR